MQVEIAILTPEKVAVSYRIARVGSRIGAFLIDLVLIYLILMAESYLVGLLQVVGGPLQAFLMPLGYVIMVFSFFLYFALFEGLWNGQTIGKKALQIRTRMADGTPITFPAALFRSLLLPGDFMPSLFLLGISMMFLTEKSQRLGDLVANTMVTHENPPAPVFPVAPHKFGIHPFEEHIGDLRGMSAEEYHAIKRLCDRFPELPEHAQAKLMQDVWLPFKSRMNIESLPQVHDVYLMEAIVMKYARSHGLV